MLLIILFGCAGIWCALCELALAMWLLYLQGIVDLSEDAAAGSSSAVPGPSKRRRVECTAVDALTARHAPAAIGTSLQQGPRLAASPRTPAVVGPEFNTGVSVSASSTPRLHGPHGFPASAHGDGRAAGVGEVEMALRVLQVGNWGL